MSNMKTYKYSPINQAGSPTPTTLSTQSEKKIKLKYKATRPSIVKKNVYETNNGHRIEYTINNAKILANKSNASNSPAKLRWVKIAQMVSPFKVR